MAADSNTAIKSMSLVSLMILTVMVPMVDFHFNPTVSEDHAFTPQSLELGERIVSNTGGRAPCPTNQYDGGTVGDADGSTSTTKTFGTDPSNQNVIGCIDATDLSDFYSVTLAANKQFTVELTVPLGADYDLALAVQQGASTYTLISSQASDPLERIVFMGNNSTAGTYYVAVMHYSGDGDYSLDMWTNSSIATNNLTQQIRDWTSASSFTNVEATYSCRNTNSSTIVVGEFSDYTITIDNQTLVNNYTTRTDIFISSYNDNGTWNWVTKIGGDGYDSARNLHCNENGDFLLRFDSSTSTFITSNNNSVVYGTNTVIGGRIIISFDQYGNFRWFDSNHTQIIDTTNDFIYTTYWNSNTQNEDIVKSDWDGNIIWSKQRLNVPFDCGGTVNNLVPRYVTNNESLVYTELCQMESQVTIGDCNVFCWNRNINFEYAYFVVTAWNKYCGTCKKQKVVLDQAEKDFKNVLFLYYSHPKMKDVAKYLKIDHRSTILVYKGNEEVSRTIGQVDKSNIYTSIQTGI